MTDNLKPTRGSFPNDWDQLDAYTERVRAETREACAVIAETPFSGEQDDITMQAKDRIAAAIRAQRATGRVKDIPYGPAILLDDVRDADMFAWWFGPRDKTEFLPIYLTGLAERWTLDQWRSAIAAAIRGEKDHSAEAPNE